MPNTKKLTIAEHDAQYAKFFVDAQKAIDTEVEANRRARGKPNVHPKRKGSC